MWLLQVHASSSVTSVTILIPDNWLNEGCLPTAVFNLTLASTSNLVETGPQTRKNTKHRWNNMWKQEKRWTYTDHLWWETLTFWIIFLAWSFFEEKENEPWSNRKWAQKRCPRCGGTSVKAKKRKFEIQKIPKFSSREMDQFLESFCFVTHA